MPRDKAHAGGSMAKHAQTMLVDPHGDMLCYSFDSPELYKVVRCNFDSSVAI